MRRGVGVLAMVALLALVACSGSGGGSDTTAGGGSDTTAGGGSDTTAAEEGGGAASVSIIDFEFSAPASVAAGTEITVVNNGDATHTWTEPGGAFDTGQITPGSSATVTIDTPGTYDYVCSIHTNMTGTIEVTDA
jgi:plastocyanin